MRKSLLETFDKVYILDLHGNSSKKEKDPNGGKDENVFDIQQGVSINIFIKNQNGIKQLKHFDLYGRRELKYDFLKENGIRNIKWKDVEVENNNCFFTSKNTSSNNQYLSFLSTIELFNIYNSGIQTKRDAINIHFTKEEAESLLTNFKSLSVAEIKRHYDLPEDGRDWTVELAKKDILKELIIHKEHCRPFDYRFSFYTGRSKGIVAYPRQIVSKHIIGRKNYGICLMRQFFQDADFSHVLISEKMIDERTMYSNRGGTYIFPLYLYPETTAQISLDQSTERKPNLNMAIVQKIADGLGLRFVNEKEDIKDLTGFENLSGLNPAETFAPIDILDYIYAVLHSPTYREKYKEFLKIDFPRIPYPKRRDAMHRVSTFWQLVKLGGELRQIHLLESPVVEKYITQYPVDGDNVLGKPRFVILNEEQRSEESKRSLVPREDKTGRVYINDTQYFDNVPEAAWNFYIGGYQPAQKWLKNRKGRTLNFEDIQHYQKIIVALSETGRIMAEIDKIEIE